MLVLCSNGPNRLVMAERWQHHITSLCNSQAPKNVVHIYFFVFQDGDFEIPLDNDQQDLAFYSVESGDALLINW